MSDPLRLMILKALSTRLETITLANGYNNDLSGTGGLCVFRGRMNFGKESPPPRVAITEYFVPDQEPQTVGDNLVQTDNWVLLLTGWSTADASKDNPSDDAHVLMADVKKCIGKMIDADKQDDYMLGGLVANIKLEPGCVRPPDEDSAYSYFFLRVILEVVESLDDPYRIPS